MHTESTQTLDSNGRGAEASTRRAAAPNGAIIGIAREFQNLVADIEDLIQSTSSLNAEELARAKAKLHARVASAKDSIQQITSPIVDSARSTVRGTDSYVKEQPWRAIGIAAGASLVIGYLLGRRT